jgi:hypothetical protein
MRELRVVDAVRAKGRRELFSWRPSRGRASSAGRDRENLEKAARSRSAKFTCSCVHHELSCSSLLIEPTVTGDRQKSRRLIGKRADG